jgi:hypothetical protein
LLVKIGTSIEIGVIFISGITSESISFRVPNSTTISLYHGTVSKCQYSHHSSCRDLSVCVIGFNDVKITQAVSQGFISSVLFAYLLNQLNRIDFSQKCL